MSLFNWVSRWFQTEAPAPSRAPAPNNTTAADAPPDDSSESDEFDTWLGRRPLPPIAFEAITEVGTPPANDQVKASAFYAVARNEQPKWALFLCPCGCGEVITLSLQKAHYPRWTAFPSQDMRPTLRPSVWRDVGCFSHFILQDGRIYWCNDSGTSPDVARKRFHSVA